MAHPDQERRKEAVRALINLALLESALLITVALIYLRTGEITHLAGGIAASMLIFGPMFFRWFRAHGAALKAKTNSIESQNDE